MSETAGARSTAGRRLLQRKCACGTSGGTCPACARHASHAAPHEFGHLIGLQHVACEGNADRCYGVTAEQKLDIMGYGSDVSPKDYAPFQKIMERYGRDTQPEECNKWALVTPG